jgi:uncharacterized membrane protein
VTILDRVSDQTSPESEETERSGPPFWRRPWVLPLAVLTVFYIYSQGVQIVPVPPEQRPLPPHDNFPLYYPMLLVHMAGGTVAMLTVVLQVWPWLRQHHPKVHRVTGRVYLVATLVTIVFGLVIVWWAPMAGKVGALTLLLFWLGVTAVAYDAVRRGDYRKHRRFMLYSFAVATNNMWGAFFLMAITWLKVPLDMNYFAEGARWIPWVGNVFLVQWWLDRTAGHEIPAPAVDTIKA